MILDTHLLSMILEHLEEGIFIWKPSTKTYWCSTQLNNMMGIRENATGSDFAQRCRFQEDGRAGALMACLRDGDTSGLSTNDLMVPLIGVLQRGDVELRAIRARVFAIKGDEPSGWFVVGIVEDVDDFEKTKQLLTESQVSKEDFLSKVSHEIRTPLNGVVGMIHCLSQSHLSETQREYLAILKESNDSIIELITEVLDYYKLETAQIHIKSQTFSMDDVLKTLRQYFQGKADSKHITLSFDVSTTVPTFVVGDPDRILQILSNLISNAIKFTEKGRVEVRFSSVKAGAGCILKCVVEDTGCGIEKGHYDRLFEKFAQSNTVPSDVRGIGLGLAICKQLVTLLNGAISVSSSPQGSQFWVDVPLGIDALAIQAQASSLKGGRFLVIDDSIAQQQVMTQTIEMAGGYCDRVSSAKEGIYLLNEAAFEQKPYHVVIIDYLMSGMDGLETSKRLLSMTAINTVKRLLVTGNLGSVSTENLIEVGLDGYLTKPFTANDMILMLKVLLNSPRQPQKVLTSFTLKEVTLEDKSVLDLSSKTILMADDNQVNRLIGKKLLSSFGCDVLLANDGQEVIDQAKLHSADLILMDCQMPHKDGYDATRELKELMKQGVIVTCPIVALTANATEKDKEKCLKAGMDAYLSKPIQMKELRQVLAEFLLKNT